MPAAGINFSQGRNSGAGAREPRADSSSKQQRPEVTRPDLALARRLGVFARQPWQTTEAGKDEQILL